MASALAAADARRAAELLRMRIWATGLLGLLALVYVGCLLGQARWPWLSYVRAFAEAGMVGACADWFAVSALFRQPLGLPIPHTGIIPRNKARIGEALGGFIADNFLTVDVLEPKLRQLEVARWGAGWLRDPDNAGRLAERLAGMAPSLLKAAPRRAIRRSAGQLLTLVIRSTPASPTAARILGAALTRERAERALDWLLDKGQAHLVANVDLIAEQVEQRSGAWLPRFVDRMIAKAIISSLGRLAEDMQRADHPLRREVLSALEGLIIRMETDPALIARGEEIKAALLADRRLQGEALRFWHELERRLEGPASPELIERLRSILITLGEWLESDTGAQTQLNEWGRLAVRQVIAPRRHQIGRFVAQVVASWDTESVVDKLELQVGKDLQYIRINGALVGGIVGLAIHIATEALRLG